MRQRRIRILGPYFVVRVAETIPKIRALYWIKLAKTLRVGLTAPLLERNLQTSFQPCKIESRWKFSKMKKGLEDTHWSEVSQLRSSEVSNNLIRNGFQPFPIRTWPWPRRWKYIKSLSNMSPNLISYPLHDHHLDKPVTGNDSSCHCHLQWTSSKSINLVQSSTTPCPQPIPNEPPPAQPSFTFAHRFVYLWLDL